MCDDFHDVKDRLHTRGQTTAEFLLTVGATLIQCQAFEDRLRQYKLLVFEWAPNMTEQQFNGLLARSRKRDTLGSLLKDLASKMRIEAQTQVFLDEFLAERNWFIHHFEYQCGLSVYDSAAVGPVIERMRDLQQRSLHLQHEFSELTVAWTEKQGFTRTQIDAAARATMEQILKATAT